MSNQVKNDIEFDYFPQKELEPDKKGLVVLFKHDYYSSNSAHGKELLSNILYSLNSGNVCISKILFVDTGVLLTDSDSEYISEISSLTDKAQSVFICSESIEEYNANIIDKNNIIVTDAELFFEQLFTSRPDIIIE